MMYMPSVAERRSAEQRAVIEGVAPEQDDAGTESVAQRLEDIPSTEPRNAGEEDSVGPGARNAVGERSVARRSPLPASCSREAEPELARAALEPRFERSRVPGH